MVTHLGKCGVPPSVGVCACALFQADIKFPGLKLFAIETHIKTQLCALLQIFLTMCVCCWTQLPKMGFWLTRSFNLFQFLIVNSVK
jgi:hypothetical protein